MTNPQFAISRALRDVEREEQVRILFAAESGSRAWGFPSPDSDWDVRFIYARPMRWHLSLQQGRDVIERPLPDDLDMSGWDMRKTLNLLLKGNCAVREWLASPIIYHEEPAIVRALRALAERVPARSAAAYHYRSLIRQVSGRWLKREMVVLKKYLYAIRPALCLRWLQEHREGTPPMDLPTLMGQVTMLPSERAAIEHLLVAKAQMSEMGTGLAVPVLDELTEGELVAVSHEPPLGTHSDELLGEAQVLMDWATAIADKEVSQQ